MPNYRAAICALVSRQPRPIASLAQLLELGRQRAGEIARQLAREGVLTVTQPDALAAELVGVNGQAPGRALVIGQSDVAYWMAHGPGGSDPTPAADIEPERRGRKSNDERARRAADQAIAAAGAASGTPAPSLLVPSAGDRVAGSPAAAHPTDTLVPTPPTPHNAPHTTSPTHPATTDTAQPSQPASEQRTTRPYGNGAQASRLLRPTPPVAGLPIPSNRGPRNDYFGLKDMGLGDSRAVGVPDGSTHTRLAGRIRAAARAHGVSVVCRAIEHGAQVRYWRVLPRGGSTLARQAAQTLCDALESPCESTGS